MHFYAKVESTGRSNFSAQHLAAAEYFSGVVASIELDHNPKKDTFAQPQYMHCWYASVVFAVMAMEANIYDIMTAADRGEDTPLRASASPITTEEHRKPLMIRYGLVHEAITGTQLATDHGIGQAARALVILRDEITHYKTEWRNNAKVSTRLEGLLKSRIKLNPFCCGSVFFPEQCVSSSSSKWAVTTAREFIVHFAASTGLSANVSPSA